MSTTASPASELCTNPLLRDHWVAIDPVGRVRRGSSPLAVTLASGGVVVDADEDLEVLCQRISSARRTSLTIVYAGTH